ncbi:hypothetical protein [uncultured Roseobacter sp.]|uniref:hypothetical protein n=1 Tax=uncultured Roseobacter sp. TaxID=114847 RepID=UPI002635D296|nr:hypothetical protein [uncultured Roseobacter sp.]
MVFKSIVRSSAGLALTVVFSQLAYAQGPLLASKTVAQWGGHETRTRCVKEAKTNGFKCDGLRCERKEWKTCVGTATEFKQHRVVAYLYGPDSISNPEEQLKDIADACLTAGLVAAGVPALAASVIDLSTEVFLVAVETCLETQNVLAEIVAPGFEVTIEEDSFW